MKWISTKERMPEPGKPVLACGKNEYNKKITMRACFIPEYFEEADGDNYMGDPVYNEEKDKFYWPKGWYEWNEYEDVNWKIDIEITYWMPLPECPE
jgi:hypothetical protein